MWRVRAEAGKSCVHLECPIENQNTKINLNIKCIVIGELKEAPTVQHILSPKHMLKLRHWLNSHDNVKLGIEKRLILQKSRSLGESAP